MARKSAKKITITKSQLLDICGSAFDRGYYMALSQNSREDRSTAIFEKWRKGKLKEILKDNHIKWSKK